MPRKKKSMPSLGGRALSHPETLTLDEIRELGGHEIAHQAKHRKTQRKKRPSGGAAAAVRKKVTQKKAVQKKAPRRVPRRK